MAAAGQDGVVTAMFGGGGPCLRMVPNEADIAAIDKKLQSLR